VFAAKKNSDNQSSETGKQRAGPDSEQTIVQRETTPLWQRMSTHTADTVAVGSQSDSGSSRVQTKPNSPVRPTLVQRLCAECDQEQQGEVTGIQPKLTIGAPNDPYEQEADAVADTVMRMPAGGASPDELQDDSPQIQRKLLNRSPIQRMCAGCDDELEHGGSPSVQTKSNNTASQNAVSSSVANTINSPGSGSPLNDSVRSRVEPVLGADLSAVRVHSGAAAQDASQSLNAKAFANQNNIFLGANQSSRDLSLMAHEITHVVQQTGGRESESGMVRRFGFAGEEIALTFEVLTSDISQWDETRRVAAIRTILRKVWVASPEEYALEKLWSSFGDEDFLRVAEENLALWQESYDRGLEITNLELTVINERLREFERQAEIFVLGTLEASEAEVQREKIRYGITTTTRPVGKGVYRTIYHIQDTPDVEGLRIAARQLLEARESISAKRSERTGLETTVFNRQMGEQYTTISNQGRYDQLAGEISSAEEQYETLRVVYEDSFPILGAFADRGWSANQSLRAIAEGQSWGFEAAEEIGSELRHRLDNIAEIRRRLDRESDVLYLLPRVVQVMESQMQPPLGELGKSLIRARANEAESDQAFVDMVLAALAIGFGLLAAIPTGGGSLAAGVATVGAIGSVGTSVVTAARSLDRYVFETAASGTDLQKAQALSAADPSFLWVAIDIVSIGIELGAARVVFNEAVPVIRRAISATGDVNGVEAAQRVSRLLQDAGAGADEAAAAASSIRRQIAEAADPETALGQLHRQLNDVEEAIALRQANLEQNARVIPEARVISEIEDTLHELKAASNGMLIRCSNECLLVSMFYWEDLAANPSLRSRLNSIESAARNSPDGGSWSDDAIQLLEELRTVRIDRLASQLPEVMRTSMARILSRELPQELEHHILEVVTRVVSLPDTDATQLARMLDVLSHSDEITVYEQMANTIVRLNMNRPNGERIFHGIDSIFWGPHPGLSGRGSGLSNFEEVSMLEAQLRGYRPSQGATRSVPTGVSGEALEAARTAEGAQASVLLGDPVTRANFERILETRGEVLRRALQDPELMGISNRLTQMIAERLHLSGAGFGVELVVGISYGQQVINQVLQNRGVEAFIRMLQSSRPAGMRYVVTMDLQTITRTVGDESFEFFESVTYQVRAVSRNTDGTLTEVRPMFETTIDASVTDAERLADNIGLSVEPGFGAAAGHFGIGAPRTGSGVLDGMDELALIPAEGVPLHRLSGFDAVDFRAVDLSYENLEGFSLLRANLSGQDFAGTILRGANLTGADLTGANLVGAVMDGSTILPDGTRFAAGVDLQRFTNPLHPEYWGS